MIAGYPYPNFISFSVLCVIETVITYFVLYLNNGLVCDHSHIGKYMIQCVVFHTTDASDVSDIRCLIILLPGGVVPVG